METNLTSVHGLRIAVEGCGHGTLNAIYTSVQKACEIRAWDSVDLLIIGGDFQAVRDAPDLTVMSCPVKYRAIGDFHAYYSGSVKAPYLTLFVGGNHEASNHLWELYYGGWVAPNIYYMGAANVLRLGGVRIAGMSGIWKGYNYNKTHHERLPYNQDDVKSIYHVRELDVRKLLQIRSQIDIGISHDWPRAIEKHGDERHLFRMKPDFEQESKDGTLGNQAATYVMDRLRPPYWFAAHMHCKFAAIRQYDDEGSVAPALSATDMSMASAVTNDESNPQRPEALSATQNADEIDLDLDDNTPSSTPENRNGPPSQPRRESSRVNNGSEESVVPSDIRAQLPAAFSRTVPPGRRTQPGQPVPLAISNKTLRFLALDKCLPGRKFLQLLEVQALEMKASTSISLASSDRPKPTFEYDPEWLAIARVFAPDLVLGNRSARPPPDAGEEHYRTLIDIEMKWVDEHIVQKKKLVIPENFQVTAPPYQIGGPEIVSIGPREYNNPQTQSFCELIGIENRFFATPEQEAQRFAEGPSSLDSSGRGNSRGRAYGNGSRGGHGRGGGRGRGRARDQGRERGRG